MQDQATWVEISRTQEVCLHNKFSVISVMASGYARLFEATTNNYIRRKFTPFGGARTGGVVVGGVTWRGDHGFLEKPVDANSGLSQIGARFYDNSLGTFISVDPLLDTADTHQANAYVYSKNSPMSNSDPDGMRNIGDWDSAPSRGNSGAGGSGTQTTTTTTTSTTTIGPVVNPVVVQPKPAGLKLADVVETSAQAASAGLLVVSSESAHRFSEQLYALRKAARSGDPAKASSAAQALRNYGYAVSPSGQ